MIAGIFYYWNWIKFKLNELNKQDSKKVTCKFSQNNEKVCIEYGTVELTEQKRTEWK